MCYDVIYGGGVKNQGKFTGQLAIIYIYIYMVIGKCTCTLYLKYNSFKNIIINNNNRIQYGGNIRH